MLNVSKSCQIKNLADIYNKYLTSLDDGVFVEVGAYDGESFSNTSCLADVGWRGVYVEPVEEFYKKCKKRHEGNNVVVLNNSVGSVEGEFPLYVAGCITTTKVSQLEMYRDVNWLKKRTQREEKCTQITLERVLKTNGIEPNFDLLVVDVEGSEVDVFNSFSLSAWKPKMLIVELEDRHPTFIKYVEHIEQHKGLRSRISSEGYVEVYRDSINTVFVDNRTYTDTMYVLNA
jgi:FkbM family methyltransferase